MKNEKKANKFKARLIGLAILLVIVVLGLLAGGVFKTKSPNLRVVEKLSKSYKLSDKEKDQASVRKISKLTEADKKSYSVYKNVKNGDYLVVIKSKKVAVVYRESEDKIIRIDPVRDTVAEEPKKPEEPKTPKKTN